jgi:predicted transcriptional regulator
MKERNRMYTNCARIFRLTVPAVKAILAKDLTVKYGLSEKRIARSLGIAQPAISKYLSGRYSRTAESFQTIIHSNPDYQKIIMAIISDKKTASISLMIDRAASESRVVKKAMGM